MLTFFFFFRRIYSAGLRSSNSSSSCCYRICRCFLRPKTQFSILATVLLMCKGEVSRIAILSKCLTLLTRTTRSSIMRICRCYSMRGVRNTSPKYRQLTPNLWNTLETPLQSDRKRLCVVARALINCGMHSLLR